MKMITITWDDENETMINFSKEYEQSDCLLRADLLKDVIGMLDGEYHEVLTEWRTEEDIKQWQKEGRI
jgi:heme-degrading monooxygenase HmoA